jgi:hypothetical protein
MSFRNARLGLAACAFLLGGSTAGYAQSIYGGLRGLIIDQGGGAVANVKVTLTNESTNLQRSTVTSADGQYNFASVIPAAYTVSAEAPGFKKLERKGVAVATQQFVTVDV